MSKLLAFQYIGPFFRISESFFSRPGSFFGCQHITEKQRSLGLSWIINFSWWRSLLFRNQSTDFLCKSMDRFEYVRDYLHERVNYWSRNFRLAWLWWKISTNTYKIYRCASSISKVLFAISGQVFKSSTCLNE